MTFSRLILVLTLLFILTSQSQGQRVVTNDMDKFYTVKLSGGWNIWLWGSYELSEENELGIDTAGEYAGGISYGAAFLLGDNEGLQYGIEAIYLPVFFINGQWYGALVSMLPVTADIVWNMGFTYTDAGLGIAYLSGPNSSGSPAVSSPSVIAKLGAGVVYRFSDSLGLDIGAAIYYPFSSFGGSAPGSSLFNSILINFIQVNGTAGIDIFF